MKTLFAVALVLAVVAAPAIADDGHSIIAAWEPGTMAADAAKTATKLAAPESSAEVGSMGILYATHTDTLSLQASYKFWDNGGWAAFGDVFWAPAIEAVGGGVSVAPPDDTPVVRQILAITGADRIGFGVHYHDAWEGTIYIVKDLVGF